MISYLNDYVPVLRRNHELLQAINHNISFTDALLPTAAWQPFCFLLRIFCLTSRGGVGVNRGKHESVDHKIRPKSADPQLFTVKLSSVKLSSINDQSKIRKQNNSKSLIRGIYRIRESVKCIIRRSARHLPSFAFVLFLFLMRCNALSNSRLPVMLLPVTYESLTTTYDYIRFNFAIFEIFLKKLGRSHDKSVLSITTPT